MRTPPLRPLLSPTLKRTPPPSILRPFHSSPSLSKNRIHPTPIRSPQELDTLLLTSSSSNQPLLTLFTASWCPSCRQVLPLIKSLIEEEKAGEAQGGVRFAEIEYDAPGNMELGERYMVTSLPTLIAFSRGEAQMRTVVRGEKLRDREFVREWIEREAGRGGSGGDGGRGLLERLFGR